jgi:hypothetical protein
MKTIVSISCELQMEAVKNRFEPGISKWNTPVIEQTRGRIKEISFRSNLLDVVVERA